MPAPNDEELIARFQEGQEGAFNELVRRYQEPIYQVARKLLGSHQEAEDVSQEAFIKAYGGLKNFRSESHFFTWIYRIAVNLSLNVLRKRKLRRFLSLDSVGMTLTSPSPTPDQEMEKIETMRAIQEAIDHLPDKQKVVFILRYFQKLPHAEIARIVNRDVNTVKANYHHALHKLQKAVR